MSMSGSGVWTLAAVACREPSGPRGGVMSVPIVGGLLPGGLGLSQVDAADASSVSCRYSTGPSGERCHGGTQFTSEPSGFTGLNVPGEDFPGPPPFPALVWIWMATG